MASQDFTLKGLGPTLPQVAITLNLQDSMAFGFSVFHLDS